MMLLLLHGCFALWSGKEKMFETNVQCVDSAYFISSQRGSDQFVLKSGLPESGLSALVLCVLAVSCLSPLLSGLLMSQNPCSGLYNTWNTGLTCSRLIRCLSSKLIPPVKLWRGGGGIFYAFFCRSFVRKISAEPANCMQPNLLYRDVSP